MSQARLVAVVTALTALVVIALCAAAAHTAGAAQFVHSPMACRTFGGTS